MALGHVVNPRVTDQNKPEPGQRKIRPPPTAPIKRVAQNQIRQINAPHHRGPKSFSGPWIQRSPQAERAHTIPNAKPTVNAGNAAAISRAINRSISSRTATIPQLGRTMGFQLAFLNKKPTQCRTRWQRRRRQKRGGAHESQPTGSWATRADAARCPPIFRKSSTEANGQRGLAKNAWVSANPIKRAAQGKTNAPKMAKRARV
jgi:hypothetical protein